MGLDLTLTQPPIVDANKVSGVVCCMVEITSNRPRLLQARVVAALESHMAPREL